MGVSEPIETLTLRTTALLLGLNFDKKKEGGNIAMLQFIFPELSEVPPDAHKPCPAVHATPVSFTFSP